MKNFYICDKAAWDNFPKEHFRYSHWIPTDDPSKIMVVAEFQTDSAQDFWETEQRVETLPHFLLTADPVKPEHHAILKKAIGAEPQDRTIDLARKAAEKHPLFRPDR